MNGLACCAWCGRVVDDRRVVLKMWTVTAGKITVPYCDSVCALASSSYLDERMNREVRA